ncbi:MAG: BatA domain-containing protein [Phycisphaerales bacterium]|nr:BatA domain-containing protein [Phycisphaerales bacterium]
MLAVAFLNPLLLSGLGLSVLPIVIHLLSRRRYRRVEWGATRFLLEAEKQNRRRVRFEQWLLVALRCLAMALLALLISRPFAQPGSVAALFGGRGQVHRIVVVDDSASMGYRSGSRTDLAEAAEALDRMLGWLAEGAGGDLLSVYLTSHGEGPLIDSVPLNPTTVADVREKFSRLGPSDLRARPRETVSRIAALLADTTAKADVYVFSDFQRTDWIGGGEGGASVFEPLQQIRGDRVRVVLLSSSGELRSNVAITEVRLERAQTIASFPVVALVDIANHSPAPLRDVRLTAEVGGQAVGSVSVDEIAPGESRTTTIEVAFPEEGAHELALKLGTPDGFALDDERRITVIVKPTLAVLIVNGAPSTDAGKDEARLLHSALAPPGPFSSGMRIDVVDPAEFEASDLRPCDVVILANIPPCSENAAENLREYVRGGGGLLIFLGDRAGDGDDYSRVLYADGTGVLPAPLEGPPTRAPGAGVGLIRAVDHPVTTIFPAGAASLSEYVRFRTWYRVEVPGADSQPASAAAATRPAAGAEVLARFTDAANSPAIIERAVGRGRVLLFTSTVDLDWNDWARAADGSYVVEMLEMTQYVARRDPQRPSIIVGEPLTLPIGLDDYEPTASIRRRGDLTGPAAQARVQASSSGGEYAVLEGPPARHVDSYDVSLTRRAGGTENRPICANLDPAESDLASARPSELDAALGLIPHVYMPAADSLAEAGMQARYELWPLLLILLVVTLMGEHALAVRFGRPLGGARAAPARGAWTMRPAFRDPSA